VRDRPYPGWEWSRRTLFRLSDRRTSPVRHQHGGWDYFDHRHDDAAGIDIAPDISPGTPRNSAFDVEAAPGFTLFPPRSNSAWTRAGSRHDFTFRIDITGIFNSSGQDIETGWRGLPAQCPSLKVDWEFGMLGDWTGIGFGARWEVILRREESTGKCRADRLGCCGGQMVTSSRSDFRMAARFWTPKIAAAPILGRSQAFGRRRGPDRDDRTLCGHGSAELDRDVVNPHRSDHANRPGRHPDELKAQRAHASNIAIGLGTQNGSCEYL